MKGMGQVHHPNYQLIQVCVQRQRYSLQDTVDR